MKRPASFSHGGCGFFVEFDLFFVDYVCKPPTNDHMQIDTFITLRVTAELREQLKAAAKQANMPMSVFLRILLTRIVKQK